jgi:hypothetical protein
MTEQRLKVRGGGRSSATDQTVRRKHSHSGLKVNPAALQ